MMRASRRRAHPARPFVATVLLLSVLAGLHYLLSSTDVYNLDKPSRILGRDISVTSDESCHDVRTSPDQCAFIQTHCPDEEAGILSYLSLYYCRLPNAKPLGFLIITIWTGLLFSTIGIAASDFFCINLSTISSILGMSESLAGVTFLAFGNGSPDVFSTFAAINSHSGSLAIGELIGAAGFITAVVAGSMGLIRPFKVAKRSFVRDICFFIVAISFSMVFLANGSLALWECAVMVGFYIFYVVTVILWHWWLTRRRKIQEREAASRSHYVSPGNDVEPYHDEDDGESPSGRIRISDEDFNNLETSDYVDSGFVDEYEEEEERDKWLGELNSNMRINKPTDADRRSVFNPIRPSLVGALEFRAVLSSLQKSRNIQPMPMQSRRYSDAQYINAMQEERALMPNHDRVASEYTFAVNGSPTETFGAGLLHAPMPQRVRAVSVSEASTVQPNPTVLNKAGIPRFERRGASPPRRVPSPIQEGSLLSVEDNKTPSLSISPPASEMGARETPTNSKRSRANTDGLLAPPIGGNLARTKHTSSSSLPEDMRARPHLSSRMSSKRNFRIALPSPKATSPNLSPRNRPMTPRHADQYFDTDLLLGPPVGSPTSLTPSTGFVEEEKPLNWWPYSVLPPPELMARVLFPTIYGWSEKSIWEKLLGLAAAPSFFLLTITLPVVEPGSEMDHDESFIAKNPAVSSISPVDVLITQTDGERPNGPQRSSSHPHHVTSEDPPSVHGWHRWLTLIQCFTAPLFMVLVIWVNASADPRELVRPILYSLLGSLVVLAILLTTTVPSHPPKWHFLLCFIGFAVSIAWISTIAGEVVGVLKAIGVIFNMSDAILGLTIFAVGNSLGDLVADVTVARLGYPVMALSACFGGPLLNILLGIGLSGLYTVINGAEERKHRHPGSKLKFKPYHVEVSTTLLISAVALLVTLVGLLIVVPLNGWKMDRKIGIGLITLWCLATIGNVIVELGGWGDDFLLFLRS